MNSNLYNGASQVLNWLLPRKCLICHRVNHNRNHPCCSDCYLALPFQSNYCQQCGQAFAANEGSCGRCIVSPPYYDACFCPFEYKSPISEQIRSFKYNERPELAKSIAQLLFREVIEQEIELPHAFLPVPLHLSRLRQRGFNQSKLISQELSTLLKIPTLSGFIVKSKATQPQAQQSLKQRKNNLNNSFSLRKSVRLGHVAIIDDVVTTGSTAGEIAKILKKNGVDCISVWGVAHTL